MLLELVPYLDECTFGIRLCSVPLYFLTFRQNSPSPHCQNVLLQLQSFLTSFPPLLNPVKDLRIHEFDFVHKIKEAEYLREQLREVASKLLKMGSRKDTIVVNPLFMEQVSMG